MRVWGLLALMTLSMAAHAQGKVTIYRCTDANGALTVQNNTPCPKGSKQEKRLIDSAPSSSGPPMVITGAPPPAPVMPQLPPAAPAQLPSVSTPPVARPPATPAQTTPASPPIADSNRLPPPALFECHTKDSGSYLSDNGAPKERCAPLRTTGLGGVSEGAGLACEMVTDQCQRVPDETLCEKWKQRLRETESALRFGRDQERPDAQAEFDRIGRIMRETTCGKS